MRADVEVREPRCRICRDEAVRILVNELLDWRRAPIILAPGRTHLVTYADMHTILDRAVVFHMRRRSPDERVDDYRERDARQEAEPLRAKL